jgi:hypothetical protein
MEKQGKRSISQINQELTRIMQTPQTIDRRINQYNANRNIIHLFLNLNKIPRYVLIVNGRNITSLRNGDEVR